MERLIFKEEQSFRQSFVIWVILASWLSVFVIFGYGFYQQLYLGNPFGDEPSSNSALLLSGIFTMILVTAVLLLVLNGKLVTEIWTDGVRYSFSPFVRKIKFIPLNQIREAEVRKYNPIGEYGGWGWRKRLLRKKTAFNVSGRIGLEITKMDGSVILLGTRMQQEMKSAVSRMMMPKNMQY